jgi:Domain of unknown function (DUF4388)
MSQVPKRTRRVRELAGSVWPGMAAGGYANLIAARLRKLAAAGSTGMLPVSGPGNGAIFFRDGQVAYAESLRTPAPVSRTAGLAALGLAPGAGDGPAETEVTGAAPATAASLGKLADMLALAEPTIDAVTDLLSNESRYAKFRQWDDPPAARVCPISVELLLAEVGRRQHVLRQLAAVVTADTPVVRGAGLDSPRLQVSPSQWALVVRTGLGTTPRALALELNQSVFGTTIEVYRLLALGLLAVPGQPPAVAGSRGAGRPARIMSFIRAVSDEKGSDA